MKQFLLKLWQDEEGAETAEWLVIVAMLVAVGMVVYDPDTGLGGTLTGIVTAIGDTVGTLPGGGAGGDL
jgi:Flp pilus assembly pilin Flp